MRILGREPTAWLQMLSAVLGFLVTFGWDVLTARQAGLIVALVSAVLATINALLVRPWMPTIFAGVITAGAALLAAYGLELNQEMVGTVQMLTVAVMGLVIRSQVTPASVLDNTAVGTDVAGSPSG